MMNLIPCNQHMVGSFPKLIWELFVFRQKYVVEGYSFGSRKLC